MTAADGAGSATGGSLLGGGGTGAMVGMERLTSLRGASRLGATIDKTAKETSPAMMKATNRIGQALARCPAIPRSDLPDLLA